MKYVLMAALLLSFNVYAEPDHDYSIGSAPDKRCFAWQIHNPSSSCGFVALQQTHMTYHANKKMGYLPEDGVQGSLEAGKTYLMLVDVIDIEACSQVKHYAWFGIPDFIPNPNDNVHPATWLTEMHERECNHTHPPCGGTIFPR